MFYKVAETNGGQRRRADMPDPGHEWLLGWNG
jgi:hypothetical protein